MSAFVAETAEAERVERAHLGAAQCRAELLARRGGRDEPEPDDLPASDVIRLRALTRARAERKPAA